MLFAHHSGNKCCNCREDHVAGVAGERKAKYVAFLRRYFTLFSQSSGRTTQILRPNFYSLASKSIISKKASPPIECELAWMMQSPLGGSPSVSLGVLRMTSAGSDRGGSIRSFTCERYLD
jgi:hypothetical protein